MQNESDHLQIRQARYWNWGANSAPLTKEKNDWAPVVAIPLLAAVMLVSSVFLLIIFRQNPALVITTVAGCLIVITIYLTSTTVGFLNDTYE